MHGKAGVLAAVMSVCLAGFTGTATAVPGRDSKEAHAAGRNSALTNSTPVQKQAAAALKKAEASGQAVEILALTTATSTTSVEPDGTFTLVQTMQPQRVWQDGAWHSLDPTLHTNSDQTLSPNAAAAGLVLSGGGTGPLATMKTEGHWLSLGWPTALPKPTVSGATATYANVLPDVDLVVSATDQGGFSDTLLVKTAQAAQNPQLAQLQMTTATDGLAVSTTPVGGVQATETAQGSPIFQADTPVMWDSATSATGASATATLRAAAAPSASSVKAPGAYAHIARIKTSASMGQVTHTKDGNRRSGTLTLVPDRRLLTSKSTKFPLYIDPTWVDQPAGSTVQATAEVQSYFKDQQYYNPSTLQLGYCGWDTCYVNPGGIQAHFVARSFLRMSVPSALHNNAHIFSSQLNVTFKYGPYNSCSGAPNPKIDLGWTDGVSSSTTWNKQPSWKQTIDTATPDACSGARAGFDMTSFMASHASSSSSLTFGLRADDPSDKDTWKQFTKSDVSMETHYDHAPGLPSHPATSPGGPCQTGAPGKAIIGNDDVMFEAVPNDADGGQIGTEFVVKNYGGAQVYDSGNPASASSALTSTSGGVVRLTLPRTTVQKWHTDGATKAYSYSWYTVSSDGKLTSPTTGTGSSGNPCTFTYDPTQPPAPGVDAETSDGHDSLGDPPATLKLAPCAAMLADPSATCPGTAPNRYKYQLNSGPATTVLATGGVQTVPLPLTHVGPNSVSVYSLSSGGNLSTEPAADDFVVNGPDTPFADGDMDGDDKHQADVVAAGTTGNPGLWLAPRTSTGTLDTARDIGAAGTGANALGAPSDWDGAQVMHGDFTGRHVQDVWAYYPSGAYAGTGFVLNGTGDTSPLLPVSGDQQIIPAGALLDTSLNPLGDNPTQLVPVGDASGTGTGIADLIGISGDSDNGYVLNLYTADPGGDAGSYQYRSTLGKIGESPDGASDWNDFTLVAAQPSGTPVLFALKKSTGALWESKTTSQIPDQLIGMPSTWTPITVPWSAAPHLISGDVDPAGRIELWGQDGNTVTPYTLTGTAFTAGTATSLLVPAHEWPLTSTSGPTSSCAAATCLPDTRGNTDAAASGGVSVETDDVRGNVASFDGTGYLTLPNNLLHNSNVLTLSLSFRADPGKHGILFSTGNDVPGKLNSGAMPVMYIGSDGKLYAQFWNGIVSPMISPQRVDDGQWHTATLNSTGTHQGLFLDSNVRIGMAGAETVNSIDPLNFVGAGVFPANTASKIWVNPSTPGTATRASYFSGDIANVVYYSRALGGADLDPYWKSAPMIGPIVSGLDSSFCVDDSGGKHADNDDIQIYTCNNTAAQNWSINPDGTITNGDNMCLAVAANGTANGSRVILWTCDNGAEQQWHLDSSGQIWNPQASKCLDDPRSSTTNGTNLEIYDCNLGKNQYWIES
ncbi:ricin-type beta-trefoil lectin domain protein [Actinomadura nitritigenes]|uniref:ricin-type beta-trefoil lectin domain protein n=1 Tax=Actinomadura nitritigenes TaxID=134602 RepID=UPI003D939265